MSTNPVMGGWLCREVAARFLCPRVGRDAECRVIQDVTSGEWRHVLACTLLDATQPTCDEECARRANVAIGAVRSVA